MQEVPPDVAPLTCQRCGRTFAPADGSRGSVPFAVRILAAFAVAALHAGAFVWDELSRPYCPRCRKVLSALALIVAALILAAASAAFRWALAQGYLSAALRYWTASPAPRP